jgi:hypothetical protein
MFKTFVAALAATAVAAWEQQASYGYARPEPVKGSFGAARGISGINGISGFELGSGDARGFEVSKGGFGKAAQVQRGSYTTELDQLGGVDNLRGLREQNNSFELGYDIENEGNIEDVADDFENVGALQKFDDGAELYGGYSGKNLRVDLGNRSFGGARLSQRRGGDRSGAALGSAFGVSARASSFGANVSDDADERFGGKFEGFGDEVGARFSGSRSFGGRAADFGSRLGGRIGGRTAGISDRLGRKDIGNVSYGNSNTSYSGISIEKEEPQHYGYGHTHKHTIEWGPFSYRQPRVEYGVYGPKTDFRTRGAAGHFGIDAASLKTRTQSGRLGFKRPDLANSFRRPEIENFAPKFAFKAPQVSFRGGEARTRGPENHYAGAQIHQTFEGPQTKLWAPRAEAKVWGPQGRFQVEGPQGKYQIAGPEDHYALHAPKQYISAHQHKYEVHIPEYHAPKITHEAKWTEYEAPKYEAPAPRKHESYRPYSAPAPKHEEAPQYAW